MLGLGKMWKAATGGGDAKAAGTPSTIPRDLSALRPAAAEAPTPIDDAAPSETRKAERFVPLRTATVLTTTTGKRVAARIINISQTGVAVEAELSEFTPRDIATVGSRPVEPGRRITLGMVFLFKKPLDPKLCGPEIIL